MNNPGHSPLDNNRLRQLGACQRRPDQGDRQALDVALPGGAELEELDTVPLCAIYKHCNRKQKDGGFTCFWRWVLQVTSHRWGVWGFRRADQPWNSISRLAACLYVFFLFFLLAQSHYYKQKPSVPLPFTDYYVVERILLIVLCLFQYCNYVLHSETERNREMIIGIFYCFICNCRPPLI